MDVTPYFQAGGCTIYHGDARELLPQLERVDSCITDPPWDRITHAGALGDGGRGRLVTFAPVTSDELRLLLALVQVRRWLVATVDWRHLLPLETLPPAGLEFVRFGVWIKPNGAPQFTGDRPATGWEAIGIWHHVESRKRWNGGGAHAVWNVPRVDGSHPTTKPHALLAELVRQFTEPGETIIDPFMGSGSTLLAARAMGRHAIGIELEEKWCELAAQRLSQALLPFEECTA